MNVPPSRKAKVTGVGPRSSWVGLTGHTPPRVRGTAAAGQPARLQGDGTTETMMKFLKSFESAFTRRPEPAVLGAVLERHDGRRRHRVAGHGAAGATGQGVR